MFAEGLTSKGFPLIARFCLVPADGTAPSRTAFTVSKKRFRRAVDRNAIKRRMREAWRHNRNPFESLIPEGMQCAVVLIFVGKDLPGPEDMEKGMVKLLTRMAQAIQAPDA